MNRNSMTAIAVLALLSVGMPIIASSSAANPPARAFVAYLSAAPGVNTTATGEATFQLSPSGQSLTYTLNVSNINNVFMAHIHLSPSADILVWLYPNPNNVTSGGEAACVAVLATPAGPISACPGFKSGAFSGVLAQGTITAADLNGSATCHGCSGLSSPTMSDLLADMASGQTFVNVHTQQNPAGEIQGTIIPMVSTTTTTTVTSTSSITAASGISTTEFYAVAGLLVIFVIATGLLAVRGRRPTS
ncbi:MAG: CHRD domain-containing protein [Nitrososphaerales archaeon]